MLNLAARRGIKVYQGVAEALPFPEDSFDGVLLAVTLCFVDDSLKALRECHRILRPKGSLLLGTIPADSPLGTEYARKKASGHRLYTSARFHTSFETKMMVLDAGFELLKTSSTLLGSIEALSQAAYCVKPGIVSGAGFVGLLGRKPGTRSHSKVRRKSSCGGQT
jgi:SAM-dependent methyltransferase